jgi:predicted phosphodiesterase
MSLTVGVISDLHVEPSNIQRRLAELEGICSRLLSGEIYPELGEPDMLVVLGDLIRETDEQETDRELLELLGRFFGAITVPTELLLGNHDVMTLDTQPVLEALDVESAWRIDEERELAFLNSASQRTNDPRGELSNEQVGALRERVAPMDRGLLFVHHPLRARDLTGNTWFEGFPEEAFCGNRRGFLERGQEGASVVVSGHLHEPYITRTEGTIYLGVDALNKVTGHEQNGACALVERSEQGIRVVNCEGDGTKHVLDTR